MMTKYMITTNLDKLPAEIVSALVEAGCTIEKVAEAKKPNCFDVFYNDNDSNKVDDNTSTKSELLKQLSIIESNDVIGSYARTAKGYIMDGDIRRASQQFDYMAAFNGFRKDERIYDAYLKANSLIGKLI